MLANDAFSRWLGIQIVSVKSGACELSMVVKPEMLNGFDILHGGITFSLADSALAFAANSHKRMCLSVENSIHYTESCKKGDVLTAKATEVSKSHKIAIYQVYVFKAEDKLVASFKGTVYRSSKEWEVGE